MSRPRSFLTCAVAGATAIVLSSTLTVAALAIPAAAGTGHRRPLPEGPANPSALLPQGVVAPPRGQRAPARVTRRCPKPRYGPQFYAPGRGKTVALTFDDGPGRTTLQVMAILRRFRVPATFFNIGENEAARRYAVRDEAREGFALGNHTWNHPDLATLTAAQQAAQMDDTIAEQRSIVHFPPCALRPPYGAYNRTTLELARHRRMAVWLWSVDTEDWMADGSASSYWVHRIIRLAEQEGGALQHPVVLMHNQPIGNPATVLALPTIIRFFRRHHYRFVKL